MNDEDAEMRVPQKKKRGNNRSRSVSVEPITVTRAMGGLANTSGPAIAPANPPVAPYEHNADPSAEVSLFGFVMCRFSIIASLALAG